jgi:hypothetical protein
MFRRSADDCAARDKSPHVNVTLLMLLGVTEEVNNDLSKSV